MNDKISIHKLIALSLGNIISVVKSIIGNNKLPKPPINNGIINKKIINKPWNVIHTLYCKLLVKRNPGNNNSYLIRTDKVNPIEPPIIPDKI